MYELGWENRFVDTITTDLEWVRLSDWSFKIVDLDDTEGGILKDVFSLGTKLRWKENGGAYRFGDVQESSYNSGTDELTVTMVPNVAWPLTNGATISDTWCSFAEVPFDYPNWRDVCIFQAGMASDTSQADGTTVNMDEEFKDGCNGYSTANFRFITPVTGWYQVNAKIGVTSPNADARYGIILRINGGYGATIENSSAMRDHTSNTGNVYPHISKLVFLNAGDYIDLECDFDSTETVSSQEHLTCWDGHLVRVGA